jgi:hypothetical protein
MRYQLRHIRAQRTRSSPGAKHDNSRRERAHTNFLTHVRVEAIARPVRAHAPNSVCPLIVLVFLLVRLSARSRGSVGERPLHTRKVAGSIPAGTTTVLPVQLWFLPARRRLVPDVCSKLMSLRIDDAVSPQTCCRAEVLRETAEGSPRGLVHALVDAVLDATGGPARRLHDPVPRLDRHPPPRTASGLAAAVSRQESNVDGEHVEMDCAERALKMGKAGRRRHRRPALSGGSKPGAVLAPGSPRVRCNGQGARSW